MKFNKNKIKNIWLKKILVIFYFLIKFMIKVKKSFLWFIQVKTSLIIIKLKLKKKYFLIFLLISIYQLETKILYEPPKLIMTVGLPSCGKTIFAKSYVNYF